MFIYYLIVVQINKVLFYFFYLTKLKVGDLENNQLTKLK